MSRRKELGRQWCAFVAAWRAGATLSDGIVLQEAPGVGRGRRRFPGPPDHAVWGDDRDRRVRAEAPECWRRPPFTSSRAVARSWPGRL